MGRPRSSGPPKRAFCISLEQRTVDRIDSLRKKYARISAVSGSNRQFTRSLLIEQAINQYCNWKRAELKHGNTVCGRCGQKFHSAPNP
jgi:predicted transcriptional regulator